MGIPKIEIINSRVYNNAIRKWLGKDDYLSHDKLAEYRNQLAEQWKVNGRETLGLILSSLGWPWQEKNIKCYVTGTKASFSSPLTVGYKKNMEVAFNVLTHELIHCYISQAIPELQAKLEKFYAEFPNENQIIKNHIVIHAIHEYVYRESGKLDALEADIKKCQSAPDYVRSWEIVSQLGYEVIIRKISLTY